MTVSMCVSWYICCGSYSHVCVMQKQQPCVCVSVLSASLLLLCLPQLALKLKSNEVNLKAGNVERCAAQLTEREREYSTLSNHQPSRKRVELLSCIHLFCARAPELLSSGISVLSLYHLYSLSFSLPLTLCRLCSRSLALRIFEVPGLSIYLFC